MKLGSDAFWSLTPRELAAAFAAYAPTRHGFALSQGDLDALMRRFPDEN
ncbi:phage tail assembly chaperone [Fulvimarina sp. MAC8]